MIRALIGLTILLAAPAVAEAQHEKLKELEWMIGTWRGKGNFNEMSFHDSVTYEWTLKKNFIKYSYEARADGRVVHSATGMIGWDMEKKKLVSFSFGIDGSIGHAEEEKSEKKNEWVWKGHLATDEEQFKDTRSIMKKIDDDNFEEEVQTKRKDKWVTFFKSKYKRYKKKEEKKDDK